MRSIKLNDIKKEVPGLTKSWGETRLEATLICLDYHQHKSPVNLKVEGQNKIDFMLNWKNKITLKMRNTWKDLQEVTEKGAEGIAVLLVSYLTNYKIVQRSAKGSGIDYWLSEKDSILPFQNSARLEISGLLYKNDSDYRRRIRKKKKQTEQSDNTNIPAYIAVIEFQSPKATLIKR